MFIAIDIGGTTTDIGFFKNKSIDSILNSSSFPTYQDFQQEVAALIKEIKQYAQDIEGIGISFAGVVDTYGEITHAVNLPLYIRQPLRRLLEEEFHTTVNIVIDATCSALAEWEYGNIQQYSKVVHLILGTGLGGTYIDHIHDQLVFSSIEPGGFIIEKNNGRAHKFIGTPGTLEAYVGGGNVEDFYQLNLTTLTDDDKLWEEYTEYLALGINNLNCILKPECIVIGGGIGSKRKKALENVVQKVQKYSDFVSPCTIAFTEIENNSSLIGALAVHFVKHAVLRN